MSEPRVWSARPLLVAEVIPAAARFAQLVDPGSRDDCWLWNGNLSPQGYGRFRVGYGREGSRKVIASRASWVLYNGRDLAGDLSIDHLCSTPRCVNPSHLEPVSIHENRKRASSRAGSSDAIEQRVQELLLVAAVDTSGRHSRGQIRRFCPMCGSSYATDYFADHLRRHVAAGSKYRGRRVRPRDGSHLDLSLCPDCGATIPSHMRRHRERMHSKAAA